MDWRNDMDRAYANGAFIPGADGFAPLWAAQAAAFRAVAQGHLDLPYGPSEHEKLDLFLPDTSPRGLLVFLHGGYWMAFGRKDWSHLAAGALVRGWACAIPSYGLAPRVRIAAITRQARAAIRRASALVAGPVVVTGHSAGGHLAARMGCMDPAVDPDSSLADDLAARVLRAVPISPLADLGPLLQTTMNATLHLDPAECASESPARLGLRPGCAAHVWVGAQERPAFLWQARLLSEEWACPWTAEPGRHHFDVIDSLADPASALTATCLDGL